MLHRLCQEYGALPSSGGIFDQDSYVIYGLQAISAAYAQLEQKNTSKGKPPMFTSGPMVRGR
jgi:hypothetical protein